MLSCRIVFLMLLAICTYYFYYELRDRVIRNSLGPTIIPITPDQIQTRLDVEGYQLVKHVDHITNRIYLATKPIPGPRTNKTTEKDM